MIGMVRHSFLCDITDPGHMAGQFATPARVMTSGLVPYCLSAGLRPAARRLRGDSPCVDPPAGVAPAMRFAGGRIGTARRRCRSLTHTSTVPSTPAGPARFGAINVAGCHQRGPRPRPARRQRP
jgi:hypothetical protein